MYTQGVNYTTGTHVRSTSNKKTQLSRHLFKHVFILKRMKAVRLTSRPSYTDSPASVSFPAIKTHTFITKRPVLYSIHMSRGVSSCEPPKNKTLLV